MFNELEVDIPPTILVSRLLTPVKGSIYLISTNLCSCPGPELRFAIIDSSQIQLPSKVVNPESKNAEAQLTAL